MGSVSACVHPCFKAISPTLPLPVVQALQKERESLSSQLRSAGPQQMERLANEVASLRAAAAEAGAMREQAERHRERWQAAETRLAELQVWGWGPLCVCWGGGFHVRVVCGSGHAET